QWDGGRWWGDAFAQDTAHDPVAAFDGAGAQAGGIFGEEDGHGEEPAAAETIGIIYFHPLVGILGRGHAVVPRERGVDEGVVGVEEVEDAEISAGDVG